MDYSKLSDFEINKAVAEIYLNASRAFKANDKDESVTVIGRVTYSNFDPCNNPSDAWPIIIDNSIQFNYDTCQVHCDSYFTPSVGKVSLPRKEALRAAVIVYLMMQEPNNA